MDLQVLYSMKLPLMYTCSPAFAMKQFTNKEILPAATPSFCLSMPSDTKFQESQNWERG